MTSTFESVYELISIQKNIIEKQDKIIEYKEELINNQRKIISNKDMIISKLNQIIELQSTKIKLLVQKSSGDVTQKELLDKIRKEITYMPKLYPFVNHIDAYVKEDDVLVIIDKYRK